MKIIYNTIIPFKGFSAINLFGVVFARKECKPLSKTTINHEKIHSEQMRELLYIGFYLWYFVEWLLKLPKYKSEAYYNISFECEAYKNDKNEKYTSKRALFSFLNYLK